MDSRTEWPRWEEQWLARLTHRDTEDIILFLQQNGGHAVRDITLGVDLAGRCRVEFVQIDGRRVCLRTIGDWQTWLHTMGLREETAESSGDQRRAQPRGA